MKSINFFIWVNGRNDGAHCPASSKALESFTIKVSTHPFFKALVLHLRKWKNFKNTTPAPQE